jgi:hypothetical protein
MAAVHGSGVGVLFDEFDLSTFFSQVSMTKTTQVVDDTRFQPGVALPSRSYIAGPGEGSISLQGPWDAVAAGSDVVLDAAIGTDSIITIGVGGYATVGGPALMMQALEAGYQIRSSVNDAVRVTANATANGGIRTAGVILQDLAVETTTFNGASVNNLASSAFGGVGHLHVTAFSGTSGTLKIQDSTNDSAWADLITFSNVTAVGAQRSVVTGTVDQYLRFIISADTFTSMTVACAFARYRRA